MAAKGKLTSMEELKLKQKERNSYKSEAKNEEESTPIKQTTFNQNTSKNNSNSNCSSNPSTNKLPANDAKNAVLSQFLVKKKPTLNHQKPIIHPCLISQA